MIRAQGCGRNHQGSHNLPSDLPAPYPSPCGTVPHSTPGIGVGQVLLYLPHFLLPNLPSHIPLATKLDPSRSRAWQLSQERLIAQRKEGPGERRKAREERQLGLGVGSGPSQRMLAGKVGELCSAVWRWPAGSRPPYPSQASNLEPQAYFSHIWLILGTHLR